MAQEAGCNMDIITGLHFLFENYKPLSWYWELVEMSRKVVLASPLFIVGQESRSYIGLTLVIAGMYGMLFSWMRPMRDAFENRLMVTSLSVTVFNLAVGAVGRIPAENIPSSSSGDTYTDAIIFKILVLGANTSVIGLLKGRRITRIRSYFGISSYTIIRLRKLTYKLDLKYCG